MAKFTADSPQVVAETIAWAACLLRVECVCLIAACHAFAGRVQGQRPVNSHRESMLNRRGSETYATAPGEPSKSLTSLATVMSWRFPVFGGCLTQPRPHAASSARFSQGEGNVPPRMDPLPTLDG